MTLLPLWPAPCTIPGYVFVEVTSELTNVLTFERLRVIPVYFPAYW